MSKPARLNTHAAQSSHPNLFAYLRLFRTMRARALLLVLLMLGSIPALSNLLVTPTEAGQVTNFGNNGFPTSVNLTFTSPGYDRTTNLSLGASGVVSSATLDVRGWPHTSGESPNTIGVDVGDDGDLEWAFGGPGNGSFGHLDELSNGWQRVGLNLSNGYNTTYSIRLPLNATITSATVNFSTLSELTLSGSDLRDSYLHNPNPTWGNTTYKNCNYGNSTIIPVGKTQWSNWHIYRGIFWFNLSQFPAVTVLDANLSFWVDDVVNNANTGQPVTALHNYRLRPLLKDWEEGLEVNIPVQQGPGVTWNNAIDNVTGTDYAWASAGASGSSDRGAVVATITETPANLEQTWMDFNSQSLTNLVQSWVNGSVSNQGLLFLADENTNKPDASMVKIMSRDNSTHGPKLKIVFEGSDDVTAGFDVGDDGIWEWNHAGNLSNSSQVPDFSTELNSLLANATTTFTDNFGNEFVDIPLNVSGNATLILDEIDIRYDWNPSVTISPQGNLASEINQHLSNLTPDPTGNVSIVVNVTSGSAGVVELSNLLITLGDRPPSIGSLTIPTETLVPNGESYLLGLQVTSYQELANLSWVALTPQLQSGLPRPVLLHSLVNGSSWVTDPGGYVANLSGQWQALNSDTGQMEWSLEVSWAWPPAEDVVWLAQAGTLDTLHSERFSSATTDHERRLEIDSFHVYDETSPTDGAAEVFEDEWVAGNDSLRVAGAVRFLNLSSHPQPGDVLVELENVSGNSTVDMNGDYSIDTNAPSGNRYGGFTISGSIDGPLDATLPGSAVLTFRVDATRPGLLLHSPTGSRVIPNSQQPLNVSIAESIDAIGVDDTSLTLHYWVEGQHDDGDGVPEADEYATRQLLRDGVTDNFLGNYDDSANIQGQTVALYIEGSDLAGNTLNGGGPGFEEALHHYISLVPSPTTLVNATLELSGGSAIVPIYPSLLHVTLYEENWLEDIESIVIEIGPGIELMWQKGGQFNSSDPDVQVYDFSLTGVGNETYLDIAFYVTPLFDPEVAQGDLVLLILDSSGEQVIVTNLGWSLNFDIRLADFAISLADDPSETALQNDSYVAQGELLLLSGRVRYVAADLPPPPDSYSVWLEVPQNTPLLVQVDDEGKFSGTLDALGTGLYQVTMAVDLGAGEVNPLPQPIRLQLDDQPPLIVGSAPNFIAANSTQVTLQFDVQEIGAGIGVWEEIQDPDTIIPCIDWGFWNPSQIDADLDWWGVGPDGETYQYGGCPHYNTIEVISAGDVTVTCQVRRGFATVGEQIEGTATGQTPGEVTRHLVDLSFQPLLAGDALDCWFDVSDLAGNKLSGIGSAQNWPLSLPVYEIRADLEASELSIEPKNPVFGLTMYLNLTLVNLGNYTDEPFMVAIETHIQLEGRVEVEELGRKSVQFLQGESTAYLSFEWIPDWEGDLDFVVHVDADEVVSERDENNSQSWSVTIQPQPRERASSTLIAVGLGLLLLVAIAMLGLAIRLRKEEGDSEEWADESDLFEPESSLTGEVQPDGYEYLEWPEDSDQWWHRGSTQEPWTAWVEDD
jgi:hypothetical protein